VLRAFLEGWRRVVRAPVLSASVIAAVLLLAVPLDTSSDYPATPPLGNRLEAEEVVALWTGDPPFDVAPKALAYVLFWMFLSGGILDRLARNRPVGAAQFFAACGVYFARFLRLGVVIGAVYYALFQGLHPYVDGTAAHAAFLAVLGLVTLVGDFAKVRAVVEDRRSMLSALGAAVRFARRRPVRTAGLYALNVLAAVLFLLLWRRVDPSSSAPAWLAFMLTHLYLALRILARLAFMASEVVFFQSELAHAGYTAAPELVWPDSPAVEAIQNLRRNERPSP
jgi:hypothetical protein